MTHAVRRERSGSYAGRAAVPAAALSLAALLAGCGTTVPTSLQQSAGGGVAPVSVDASQSTGQAGIGQGPGSGTATTSGTNGLAPSAGGPAANQPGGSVPGAPTAGPASGATGIPTSGPGWDKNNVYIGIATVTDAPTVGHLLGINSLDYGDQNSYTKAMIDYVNARGGVFGRKIVPVTYDISSTTDPNTSAQAACARFTQDRRVAVSLAALPSPTFYSCMHQAGVPVVGDGYGLFFNAKDFDKYKGWLYFWGVPSFERLVPVWLDSLQAQGYFKGWNSSTGEPGAQPVKVGLLYGDDGFRAKAFGYLKSELQRRGIDVATVFQTSSPSDYSNAVVQFRAAGVTHLIMDSGAALFYPPQAENQHYYARYGVTSQNYIQPFLQDTQPKTQLRGMMGVGWIPHQDVDLGHNPGPTAGQASCFKIMRDAGADLSKDNYRYVAETVCDVVNLFVEMAKKGGGFDPASILRSARAAGSSFPWSSRLGSGISATDLTFTPVVRPLQYVDSCSCVQYIGAPIRVP